MLRDGSALCITCRLKTASYVRLPPTIWFCVEAIRLAGLEVVRFVRGSRMGGISLGTFCAGLPGYVGSLLSILSWVRY